MNCGRDRDDVKNEFRKNNETLIHRMKYAKNVDSIVYIFLIMIRNGLLITNYIVSVWLNLV